MDAGRELDALIAEKVMGYERRLIEANSLPNTDISGATFPRADGWLFVNPEGYPEYYWGHCNDMFVSLHLGFKETLSEHPHYSTDIAAAWTVVEATDILEFNDCLTFREGHWQVGHIDCDGVWEADGYADTAPHAICLAALHAKGVEV